MRILPLTPDRASEWDDFVSRSDDAWLFHRSEWIGLDGSNDPSLSFFAEHDSAIAGIFPLYLGRRRYAGVVSTKLLHTGRGRSGPALASNLGSRARRTLYRTMFDHVDALAREHGVDRLEIRLASLAPRALPPLREDVSPLADVVALTPVKYGRGLAQPPAVDRIVCLEQPPDALWAALDKDCRNAIRKAEKSGVIVSRADARARVEDYHRLHVQNYRRTAARPLPLEHFYALWDAFHPSGVLELFLAEHDGVLVAAVLILCFRGAATYWAGSSNYTFQHLRPNNLLVWHAMTWARAAGCRWFELGPTFPFADPDSKIRKIGFFKEQFGGSLFYLREGAKNYRPVKVALLEVLDFLAAGAARRVRGGRAAVS